MKYTSTTLQQMLNAGLNPFAVQLLAESYAQHSNPIPVAFSYESTKNGKPIKVYIRLDPEDPSDEKKDEKS